MCCKCLLVDIHSQCFSWCCCFSCRGVKTSLEIQKQETEPVQHKDYSLKAGQKIQINLGVSDNYNSCTPDNVGVGV